MHVTIAGAFNPDYARHAIIIEGLQAIGVNCHIAQIPAKSPTRNRWQHLRHVFHENRHSDIFLIPAFNQTSGFIAWGLSKRYRVPVVMDYMVGLLDVQRDRGSVGTMREMSYRWIDRFNTRYLHTLTDTDIHRQKFSEWLQQPVPKMHILPVGVKNLPLLSPPDENPEYHPVQYTGTYIPFHGMDILIAAAKRLPHVPFEFIGSGQTLQSMKTLAAGHDNIKFVEGYFDTETLLKMQSRSRIMTGVFGDSEKTCYVIPNKVYEALALGRPLITAESPALHEFLIPGEHLLTVPAGDAEALANTIQALLDNPQEQQRLCYNARQHIENNFLPEHIGTRLQTILETIIQEHHKTTS